MYLIYIKPSITLSILESYNFVGIKMVLRELSSQELSQLALAYDTLLH